MLPVAMESVRKCNTDDFSAVAASSVCPRMQQQWNNGCNSRLMTCATTVVYRCNSHCKHMSDLLIRLRIFIKQAGSRVSVRCGGVLQPVAAPALLSGVCP